MDKQLKTTLNFVKHNPITMVCIAAAILIIVGIGVYSRSNNSALQRRQVESEAKLAQALDDSKKVKVAKAQAAEEAKKKAEEEKKVQELKLAEEKKASDEAAAVAAAEAAKKKTYTAPAPSSGSISLSAGSPVPKEGTEYFKVPVNWTAGFNSEKGFKLVWNTTGSPTYPESNPEYHDGGTSGSGYIKVPSGTYYVRVCQYLGDGACGVYSNQVTVVVP